MHNYIISNKVKLWRGLALLFLVVAIESCSSRQQEQTAQEGNEQLISSGEYAEITIPVEGMTCNVCVASVKKKLTSIEGLQSVEVSLEHRQASIFYEPGKVTPEQVQKAINELGFKAGEPKKSKQ